ncbi:murein hydrolase activator EnvC family protein [Ferruginibacter sp. SUN002]|uniref:murein hydrolase activator EnvC family protein n=1 Tax=Ferruginibacter sp. SUN002 TaxID=2937789 RepID=UPI003D35D2D3
MLKFILSALIVVLTISGTMAQPPKTKEQLDLEKQRQDIKKEIEQTQKQLDKINKSTKVNLGELALIKKKLDLQNSVIENINRDINLLDNNIYRSQKDIRKLTLLLDTLKKEYAKSMVYAYKNRSNSDFLNFIFSASSFNDAVKRVAYLKSYRAYREMQGENIIRTQNLLRGRVEELNGTKLKKGETLELQSKELTVLADEKQQKNLAVSKLQSQSKELNAHIAASKKKMSKVSAAIAAAIERARKEAIAEAARIAAANKPPVVATITKPPTTTSGTKPPKIKTTPVKQSVLLASAADVKLNASFESNRGSLPWPVDKGYVMVHFGRQKLEGTNVEVNNPGITIGSDIGSAVKAIFDGEVTMVQSIDNMQIVIIKHGKYFSTYSNLSGVTVTRGQTVRTGQVLGRVAANDEGIGSMDLITSNETSNVNPESWLK